MAKHLAGGRQPLSLSAWGRALVSSPPQPDDSGTELVLCPPRRCFCWKGWHSRHGLMLVVMTTGGGCCARAEQGRKGRETDGGGEGLSQQEVRHGGSRHSAGMEDTLEDADITGRQEVFAPSV